MGRLSRSWVVLSVCLLGLRAAHGAERPVLSLDQALEILRTKGPDVRLAEAQVQGAQADVVSAGARPNPSVGAGLAKTFGYGATCEGCASIGYSLSVSDNAAFSDELSGKHALRIRVAKDALEAARHGQADAMRTVALALEQQYAQAALAKEAVALAQDVQTGAAETLRLTQVRLQAGAISEADVVKAETAKLEADQQLEQANQQLEAALAGLSAFFGPGNAPADFTVDASFLHRTPPAELLNASKEALAQSAFQHRPDLQQAEAAKVHADSALMLAERLRVPDVAVSLQHAQEGVGPNALQPPTVSLGVSLPLPVLYRYEGEVAHAEVDRDAASLQSIKLQSQISADVGSAFAVFSSTRSQVKRMEDALLDRATRSRDLVKVQYEKGAASLLEYLDAQRTWIAVRGEYLQNLADLWMAVFQLEAAVGTEFRS